MTNGPNPAPVGPLYHGGVPGLRPGDLLTPGHTRPTHPGCPWCAARKNGTIPAALDGPSEQHAVYVTTHRLYAAHYASLYGRGDLYRIEATHPLTPSTEDTIPTWHTPQATIAAVLDRAVQLRPTDRRRLYRDWTAADHAAGQLHDHARSSAAPAKPSDQSPAPSNHEGTTPSCAPPSPPSPSPRPSPPGPSSPSTPPTPGRGPSPPSPRR